MSIKSKSLCFLFACAILIFTFIGCDKISQLNKINSRVEYDSILGFDGQLFPSVILSTALSNKMNENVSERNAIGNNKNFLGCRIKYSSMGLGIIPVKLEIEGERYISKSVIETTVHSNRWYKIYPDIVYNFSLLENMDQPRFENLTYRIYCFGELKKEFTESIQFRSINEVPFFYIQDNGKYLDISYLFAAYVNEDNPVIDQLLKEALNIGIVNFLDGSIKRDKNTFSGYHQKDNFGVVDQVFAIWNVLQRRGIKYSSITTTSASRNRVSSQYVRTITDSLNSNQANCVDGSVLFASVLRKIGIDTFLVLSPGHMRVGFWVDREHSDALVIETTMLGDVDLDEYFDDKTFFFGGLARFLGSSRNEVSRASFIQAVRKGTEEYNKYLDEFNDPKNIEYQRIDISQLRKEGIKPIPR